MTPVLYTPVWPSRVENVCEHLRRGGSLCSGSQLALAARALDRSLVRHVEACEAGAGAQPSGWHVAPRRGRVWAHRELTVEARPGQPDARLPLSSHPFGTVGLLCVHHGHHRPAHMPSAPSVSCPPPRCVRSPHDADGRMTRTRHDARATLYPSLCRSAHEHKGGAHRLTVCTLSTSTSDNSDASVTRHAAERRQCRSGRCSLLKGAI